MFAAAQYSHRGKVAYSKTRNGGTTLNRIPEHQIRNGEIRNTNLWNHSRLNSIYYYILTIILYYQ